MVLHSMEQMELRIIIQSQSYRLQDEDNEEVYRRIKMVSLD